MRAFYRFLLRWSEFDLAIALDAPVRNPTVVAQCNADIRRWELALFKKEHTA